MKSLYAGALLIAIVLLSSMSHISTRGYKKILGVFDGRTPCAALRAQMKLDYLPECTKIKWRLTLYAENGWKEGGLYTLEGSQYRKTNPRTGEWKLRKGSKENSTAEIVELRLDNQPTLLLQKLDGNILLFVDGQEKLMVGDSYLSYALSRSGMEN